MHYDYLIVGAGLFGATFAHEMNNKGKTCLVIDKRSHIAGNAYTESVNSIDVHKYGAHIFHTSNLEVWNYVNQFATFNNFINSPLAIFQDEIYNLPFNMNTFSKMWNIKTPEEAKKIIEEQTSNLKSKPIKNLEEQAIHLVGSDIYQKLIKGYTEKQWGKDCKDLPAFIIKRLPVRFTYDNNYFNDLYQGIPVEGYTKLVENMLEDIPIQLNTDFFELKQNDITYDKLVFTGRIDEYYNFKFGPLEYRSLEFKTENLPLIDNFQGNAVINYTERKIAYTRIIEHKHFTKNTCKGTVISREYPKNFTYDSEPYYPINNEKNNQTYQKYKELSDQNQNIIFGGRLGNYKYYDMDKVIASALKIAQSQ